MSREGDWIKQGRKRIREWGFRQTFTIVCLHDYEEQRRVEREGLVDGSLGGNAG